MIYQVTKPQNSNAIISELNAKVLSSTFKSKEGIQKADLYISTKGHINCPPEIVSHGTCGPACMTFSKTINIIF